MTSDEMSNSPHNKKGPVDPQTPRLVMAMKSVVDADGHITGITHALFFVSGYRLGCYTGWFVRVLRPKLASSTEVIVHDISLVVRDTLTVNQVVISANEVTELPSLMATHHEQLEMGLRNTLESMTRQQSVSPLQSYAFV